MAKISDFGIARTAGDPALTQSGLFIGTPIVLLPRARPRAPSPTPRRTSGRSGATLYAAVEGRPPYEQKTNAVAVISEIANQPPPPPQRAGALEPVLNRMLDRDPRDAVVDGRRRPRPAPARRPAVRADPDRDHGGPGRSLDRHRRAKPTTPAPAGGSGPPRRAPPGTPPCRPRRRHVAASADRGYAALAVAGTARSSAGRPTRLRTRGDADDTTGRGRRVGRERRRPRVTSAVDRQRADQPLDIARVLTGHGEPGARRSPSSRTTSAPSRSDLDTGWSMLCPGMQAESAVTPTTASGGLGGVRVGSRISPARRGHGRRDPALRR